MTARNKPTSIAAWKKQSLGDIVELPSGNVIRMKRVGLQTLMKTGMMPNSLLSIAQKAVDKGKGFEGPTDEEMAELASDEGKLIEMMNFFDKMVCFVVAEPAIHLPPQAGVERDPELLYVDEVDDEDKMFIFQVVTGGTTDIEQFRREHADKLGVVRGREDLELPAE
jgi:hypothetical protein